MMESKEHPLSAVFCIMCGARLLEDSSFCHCCGAKIESIFIEAQESEPPADAEPEMDRPSPVEQTSEISSAATPDLLPPLDSEPKADLPAKPVKDPERSTKIFFGVLAAMMVLCLILVILLLPKFGRQVRDVFTASEPVSPPAAEVETETVPPAADSSSDEKDTMDYKTAVKYYPNILPTSNLHFVGPNYDPCSFFESDCFSKTPEYYLSGMTEGTHYDIYEYPDFTSSVLFTAPGYMGVSSEDTLIEFDVHDGGSTLSRISYCTFLDREDLLPHTLKVVDALQSALGTDFACDWYDAQDQYYAASYEILTAQIAAETPGDYFFFWFTEDKLIYYYLYIEEDPAEDYAARVCIIPSEE